MENISELENYLIGTQHSYLKNDELSSKKITMISGKWGCGKTHFFENNILRAYPNAIYISLFGKQTLEDIENEILIKSLTRKIADNKIPKHSIKMASTFYKYGVNILGAILPKVAGKIDTIKNDISKELSDRFIIPNTIICFDDFERKSKNIDLNELFGFINQLTLNLETKTIIILNSEVFKGEDQKVFIEVKEKTVSKYLHFEPTVNELFKVLFTNEFIILTKNKDSILDVLIELNIINARVIIQTLNNLKEWSTKNENFTVVKWIKLFIFLNINYILNHHLFGASIIDVVTDVKYNIQLGVPESTKTGEHKIELFVHTIYEQDFIARMSNINPIASGYNENYIHIIKEKVNQGNERIYVSSHHKVNNKEDLISFINSNPKLIQSWHFLNSFNLEKYFDSHNQAEVDIFNNINQFIKTGICKSIN